MYSRPLLAPFQARSLSLPPYFLFPLSTTRSKQSIKQSSNPTCRFSLQLQTTTQFPLATMTGHRCCSPTERHRNCSQTPSRTTRSTTRTLPQLQTTSASEMAVISTTSLITTTVCPSLPSLLSFVKDKRVSLFVYHSRIN